jgi:hypothetical protein
VEEEVEKEENSRKEKDAKFQSNFEGFTKIA